MNSVSSTTKTRLKELKRVIKEAPPGLFAMRYWTTERNGETARCALNWCRQDLWFQQNSEICEIIASDDTILSPPQVEGSEAPTFRERAATLFDVEVRVVDRLFGFRGFATPNTRGDMIRLVNKVLSGEFIH